MAVIGGVRPGAGALCDLPAVPASCTEVRYAVRDALADAAVNLADVDLAVSEAVTNVVVHAYRDRDPADGPGRVRVASGSRSRSMMTRSALSSTTTALDCGRAPTAQGSESASRSSQASATCWSSSTATTAPEYTCALRSRRHPWRWTSARTKHLAVSEVAGAGRAPAGCLISRSVAAITVTPSATSGCLLGGHRLGPVGADAPVRGPRHPTSPAAGLVRRGTRSAARTSPGGTPDRDSLLLLPFATRRGRPSPDVRSTAVPSLVCGAPRRRARLPLSVWRWRG